MTLVAINKNKVEIRSPETPMLDKQSSCEDDLVVVRNFLDWLYEEWLPKQSDNGWDIKLNDLNRPQIICAYLELDENEMENERRRILMCQRLHNAINDMRSSIEFANMKDSDRELLIHTRLREIEQRERKELGIRS